MENNKIHILVVDDDNRIRDLLKEYLTEKDYIVSTSDNAENAKIKITQFKFDLIVLDVMMPGQNGYDLTKEIKKSMQVPIILLTAKGEVENRIKGLELGADDYVTKPLSPRELVARVNANLKRVTQSSVPASKPLSLFDINEKYMQITFDGTELSLTKAEYNLLAYLIHRPKQVFSRDQLLTAIWNESYLADERTIDTHIKSLRAKLKVVNSGQETIKTHRGLGYSLSM